jgi:hypothetical protein
MWSDGLFDAEEDIYLSTEDREAAEDYNLGGVDDSDENPAEDDESDDYEKILGRHGKDFTNIKSRDWKKQSSRTLPKVTFDFARRSVWDHGKEELKFFQGKMFKAFTKDDDEGMIDASGKLLFGPDSNCQGNHRGNRRKIHLPL